MTCGAFANDGTDLALSLVRAIVEAHGGTVHVDSAPGRGATFSAEFTERG